ncbi:MAG: type II toxin-antitoxin system RelE/ParE family toxin [Hyphomonadaceae bacterium]
MTRRFRYTQRADADMVGIARFSLDHFGDAQTEKYLLGFEAAIENAIRRPALMRRRPELGDVFAVRYQSHVAFLKQGEADIWFVVAVLHGRMDPTRHLNPVDDDTP